MAISRKGLFATLLIFTMTVVGACGKKDSSSGDSKTASESTFNNLECLEADFLNQKIDVATDFASRDSKINQAWNVCLNGLLRKDPASTEMVYSLNGRNGVFSWLQERNLNQIHTIGSSFDKNWVIAVGNESSDAFRRDIDARDIRSFVPSFGYAATRTRSGREILINGLAVTAQVNGYTDILSNNFGTSTAGSGSQFFVIEWTAVNITSRNIKSESLPYDISLWEEVARWKTAKKEGGDLPNIYDPKRATQLLTEFGGYSRRDLPPGASHRGSWVFEVSQKRPAMSESSSRDFLIVIEHSDLKYAIRVPAPRQGNKTGLENAIEKAVRDATE